MIPPLNLTAPVQIDPYNVELLHNPVMRDPLVERCRNMLPVNTVFMRQNLTVPIRTVNDVRNTLRAVFRLNRDSPELEGHMKDRTTLALDILKSLNQLSGNLNNLQELREKHLDRTDVIYHIGNVVQHQHERWRGVIVGWERPSSINQTSSLTQKDYTDDQQHITYHILVDTGDAHTMGTPSALITAVQADLEVPPVNLCRIRNREIENYMIAFDAASRSFVPDESLQYIFPKDNIAVLNRSTETVALCTEISHSAQQMASRLERCILDETSAPQERGLGILFNVQQRLRPIAEGDVVASDRRFRSVSPITRTTAHLQALLNLNLEIIEINNKRAVSQEYQNQIQFRVGHVVYHKIFGFRGVIVAWDRKPLVDVSRWDGLQHVENPMEKPFYHVIPDQNDCREVFGGERPMRYVCEENLEICSENRRAVQVDFDPEFTRKEDGHFEAPTEIRYTYGDDIQDEGVTKRCLLRLQDEFNSWFLRARESNSEDAVVRSLSTDKLTELLQYSETMTEAGTIQELIKEFRKAHPQRTMRRKLDTGIETLLSGRASEALDHFKQLVSEDPTYSEAWNKVATCEFMQGKFQESMHSTTTVLKLDPSHTQALGGLALLHFENEDYSKAAECFEKAIELDPWSLVAPRLSVTYDLQNRLIEKEELPHH